MTAPLGPHTERRDSPDVPAPPPAAPPMPIRVNRASFERALALISRDKYVDDSDWSETQPSPEDENDVLRRRGWDDYTTWFLAEDTDESEETKARYQFPYGDFRRVHRSGLVAAKQRATQLGFIDVERAADRLLEGVPHE